MENAPTRRHFHQPRFPSAGNLPSPRVSTLPALPFDPTDGSAGAGRSSLHQRSFSQPSSCFSSAPDSHQFSDLLDADLGAPAWLPPIKEDAELVLDDEVGDLLREYLDQDDDDMFSLAGTPLIGGGAHPPPTTSPVNGGQIETCMESTAAKANHGSEQMLPVPLLPPGAGADSSSSSSHPPRAMASMGPGAAAVFAYADGKFSEARMRRIMADKKLTKLMLRNPTRAKRLIDNRYSQAKGHDRKEKYRSDLELKFKALETEITTLSTELAKLQSKNAQLRTENDDIEMKLQLGEREVQLKEAQKELMQSEIQLLTSFLVAEIRDSPMPDGPPTDELLDIDSIQTVANAGGTLQAPDSAAWPTYLLE